MSQSTKVLAPVVMALMLTLVTGAVALLAWSAAQGYLPQLNIEHPDIASHSPTLEYAPERKSRRVVLVIIDGLRLSDSFGRKTLDKLRRIGVDAIATSHYPSISRPNHVALVTGVPPLISGVRNNTFHSLVQIDSLMDRVNAAHLQASFVADDSPSLAYLFPDDFASMYYGAWKDALLKSARLAIASERNALIVLIPGSVDLAGHRFGGDSPEYRAAIDTVDQQLTALVQLLDLRRDTIIVTADHGHTNRGGHGGTERVVLQVPLIIAGAGVNSKALLGSAQLIDIAPTIAALLGVPAPGLATGITLRSILTLSPRESESLKRADEARIEKNLGFYQESLRRRRLETDRQTRRRLFLLLGLLLVALCALEISRRAGALHIDWRVLLFAVPAYPLCYYGLLTVLGQSLSFSALQDRGSEMSSLFRYGLVATLVQLAAGWIALRGRIVLRDRLAAANALVACGLLIAWLPAAYLWATYCDAPHVEIPASRTALLIPANYIAVATFAIGATLGLALEITIFFARASDPGSRLRRLERATAKERDRLREAPPTSPPAPASRAAP